MISLLCSLAFAEPDALELAYQREFAYLQAERQSLQQRLSESSADHQARAARAEAEIAAAQGRLLSLRARRAELEDLLADAERETDSADEAVELVDATLFQASSTLGAELPEAADGPARAAALSVAWEAGADRIREASHVRVAPGSWFRADGVKVDGDVVRIGRVAAYGVGPDGGALIPVGEGKLQVRGDETGATARAAEALAAGERPSHLPIFLFEDADRRVEEAPPKTMWSTIEAGGVVGLVILALGAVALLLTIGRAATLWELGRGADAIRAALAHLDAGRWTHAEKLMRATSGGGPRVLAAMLPLGPGQRKRLEDRGSEALLLETPRADRFGAAIMVIAAVAPLLGLLGTVTGMIGTFDIITEFGTGDPRMLSGGISEALVTTQFGLVVAIPALLVGNLLNRRADMVLAQLEGAALAVINRAEPSAARAPSAPPEPAPADALAVAHA